MKGKSVFTLIILAAVLLACKKQIVTGNIKPGTSIPMTDSLTYLALGDSYTIGQSVALAQNFPYQLAAALKQNKLPVSRPEIIATTGWTTGELIGAIAGSQTKGRQYNIVTLLIGVNNQYRGNSQVTYRAEFVQLLNTAINYAGGNKKHVFVISIPDWGVTPYAEGRDRAQIATEIDQFNAINKEETMRAGVRYVDITPISRQAATNASLTANDGLHPSAIMYGLWVKELLPAVIEGLK